MKIILLIITFATLVGGCGSVAPGDVATTQSEVGISTVQERSVVSDALEDNL